MAIATLTVDLVAKMAKFEADLGRVTRVLERQTARWSAVLGGIAGTFGAATFTGMIKGAIDAADGLNDLSQKVGISVKDLAGWELAAKQSGASLESIAKGVKGLSGYIVDHGEKLQRLGIDTTDANKALIGLADGFARMPDGVEKTALAVKLFGKAGMDMIPMLNLGSKGLQDAFDKADGYGRKMAELAPQADKFNDQLEELALYSRAAGINLSSYLVEGLNKTAENFNRARQAGLGFWESLTGIGVRGFSESVDDARKNAGAHIKELTDEIERLEAWKKDPRAGEWDNKKADFDIVEAKKKREYFKSIQREEALKLGGNYRDEGGRSTGPDMASLLDKEKKESKGKKPKWSEDDALFQIREAVEKQRRAGYDEAERAAEQLTEAAVRADQALIDMTSAGKVQKLNVELDRAANLLSADKISFEGYDEIVNQLGGIKDKGKDAMDELRRAVEGWGNKAADTFAEFVTTGKASFGDLVNSILADMVRIQARKVFDPVTKAVGDWATDAFSGVFKNADGGVYAGAGISAYSGQIVSRPTVFPFASGVGLMGEAGPEAILPLRRGPNGKLGVEGGGSNVVVNVIEAPGHGGGVQQRNENGVTTVDVMVEQVESRLSSNVARGRGSMAAVLERRYGLNPAAGAVR